jgi:hypothetical protein
MITVRVLMAATMALSVGACAHRGKAEKAEAKAEKERRSAGERMEAARQGMADAAVAPLKDIGLVRPQAPAMLAAMSYPYLPVGLDGACLQVVYELGALDAMLGPESYAEAPSGREKDRLTSERGLDAAQNAAVGAMRGATDVVPFRGLVRRATGAERAAREADRAMEIGEKRRAFLRGVGSALNCPGVLPAPPDALRFSVNPGLIVLGGEGGGPGIFARNQR